MTLSEKIAYLLSNGYTAGVYGSLSCYSKDDKRFTTKDLITCWNSLRIF